MNKEHLIALVTFTVGSFFSIFTIQPKTVALAIFGVTLLCTFIIIFYRKILNFLRCFLPLCKRNVFKKRTSERGVFGRDDLIQEILRWHNKSRSNKVAIISGAAGTGKTTLARALKESVLSASSVVVVAKSDSFYKDYKDLKEYKSNCIIVFDYVLESFEKIREYIGEIMGNAAGVKEKKRKMSVILLERDIATSSIKRFIGVRKDKVFQWNLDDYKLDNHTLTEIVKYKVQHEKDDEAVNSKITDENAWKIARMIAEQLDKGLCRPIFASILATIYRRSEHFDYNVVTKDEVFSRYWDVVTGFGKFLPRDLAFDEGIHNYLSKLKNNVKIVSVFVTITSLEILCYPESNKLQIEFKYNSSGNKVSVSPSIRNLVMNAFYDSGAPQKNLVTWLRYLYHHNSISSDDPIGIIIHPMTLDLFSSWMLSRAMEEDQSLLGNWFIEISKEDNGKFFNQAYNFIIRAAEDFGYKLFEWFSDMNLPDDVLVSQWENTFATDINYILDIKSESILQGKYHFFKKHYDRLSAVLGSSEKFERITRNIIDMIDNKGEIGHSADGLKLLQNWCEQQKSNLEKGGRTRT